MKKKCLTKSPFSCLCLLAVLFLPSAHAADHLGLPAIANSDGRLLKHIVSFHFKHEPSKEEAELIVRSFRALKQEIPYIVSLESGMNNSPEGVLSQQLGFTQVYIVTFKSEAERDYYVSQDPRHKKFQAIVGPFLGDTPEEQAKNVIVLDFFADN